MTCPFINKFGKPFLRRKTKRPTKTSPSSRKSECQNRDCFSLFAQKWSKPTKLSLLLPLMGTSSMFPSKSKSKSRLVQSSLRYHMLPTSKILLLPQGKTLSYKGPDHQDTKVRAGPDIQGTKIRTRSRHPRHKGPDEVQTSKAQRSRRGPDNQGTKGPDRTGHPRHERSRRIRTSKARKVQTGPDNQVAKRARTRSRQPRH